MINIIFHGLLIFLCLNMMQNAKRWNAMHHPFTSPQPGWENKPIGEIKARAYDVVLNGIELGGGSIRIHDAAVQDKVFDLLGLTKEQAQAKFGFLLEAQELGLSAAWGHCAWALIGLLCLWQKLHRFVK